MSRSINDPEKITYFAETDYRDERKKFGIKQKDRTKHMYIIGKTGMGKSTLLENMAVQDIKQGHGLAFLDPHGKSAELLLEYVPENRINDVLYFAPFDLEYPVAFNVMEDVGPDKRHLVANGLMSAFKKIWVDAWSARMEYILNNTLLALLEYPDSTIIGVNRMLSDKTYRKKVVENITDVSVKAFWEDEFAKYGDRYMQEAGAAIQNKIGQFISNPLVRNLIGQPKSTFDIREIMDNGKILIINLSKGRVGEANANLIGSMLITKIYLAAMSRADIHDRELQKLPNFYFFVDEFQSFANESFSDILSEARKYKLNLTIAHQYIEQMTDEVRAAVFGNVGTLLTFRVGATDAEYLEKEFAPQFTAQDLVNLGYTQIYLKLMIDGIGSAPFSARTLPPIPLETINQRDQIIARSREQFARPRALVEEDLIKWHQSPAGRLDDPFVKPQQPQQPQKSFQEPSKKPYKDNKKQDFNKNSDHHFKPGETSPEEQAREARLQKAISLTQLQKQSTPKQKPKEPSAKNLSDLRAVLSSVLKEKKENNPPTKSPEKIVDKPIPKKSEEKKEPKKTEEASKNTQNISPDELRKMLEV